MELFKALWDLRPWKTTNGHTQPAPVEPSGPAGLQRKYAVGENLPWKGIWFRIVQVDPTRIVMEPVGMTYQMAKTIQKRKEQDNG